MLAWCVCLLAVLYSIDCITRELTAYTQDFFLFQTSPFSLSLLSNGHQLEFKYSTVHLLGVCACFLLALLALLGVCVLAGTSLLAAVLSETTK